MDYTKISHDVFQNIAKAYKSLDESPVEAELRVIVCLYLSQINSCAYCCGVHAREARKLGISQDRLDALPGFKQSNLYSDKEKASLEWAHNLTKINDQVPISREKLKQFFNEKEIVDLTSVISIMNFYNRIAVSLRDWDY